MSMARRNSAEEWTKITPEMIEAGRMAVRGFQDWCDLAPSTEEALVRRILEAAFGTSLE